MISEQLSDAAAARLAEQTDVVWSPFEGPAFESDLADATGLIVRTYTRVEAALLDRAPRLRVVGRAGVGLDNIDVAACRARHIEVVHTPDANTQAVVEYVLLLALRTLRPIATLSPGDDDKRFHALRRDTVGVELAGRTLGVLGLGRIGMRLARAAIALGVPTIGCDLLPSDHLAPPPPGLRRVDHATLWRESDVLSLHVDGRPENRRLIDRGVLDQLRPNVLLINAARGLLIDHDALAAWATRSPQAEVLLDVHDPEPPPVGGPLHDAPNITLLPHLASRTDAALERMSDVVDDVLTVLSGRPPRHPAL